LKNKEFFKVASRRNVGFFVP